MAKRAELQGKRFGKLYVEEFAGIKNYGTLWRCRCDCGNYVIVLAEKLNNGRKTSCGCDSNERRSKAKIRDLTGKRFGKLVVTGLDHSARRSHWKCRCDCGNEIVACADVLQHGYKKSCGCAKINDISGQRFGRLIAKKFVRVEKKCALWECECDCGNTAIIRENSLVSGGTRSCGCLAKEKAIEICTKHGMSESYLYNTWKAMIRRCYSEKDENYNNYGGRGIEVCQEWQGEQGLLNFVEWSERNGCNEDLTIDRIDNDGNYEPSNCRWADWITQCYNKRTTRRFLVCGEIKNLKEISEEYGIPLQKLRSRYYGIYKREIPIEELQKLRC